MTSPPRHFFIRANGDTAHNDPTPSGRRYFVPGEHPQWPTTHFNHAPYSLENGIVRIGWPNTGDLARGNGEGSLCPPHGYDDTGREPGYLPPRIRRYLTAFRDIPNGSVVLMPDKSEPGTIYIGTVVGGYRFSHNVRAGHWYECAHRHKTEWDVDRRGNPVRYTAGQCGLTIRGGIWRLAFAELSEPGLLRRVAAARRPRI